YDDEYNEATGKYVYHYRTASSDTDAARRQAEVDNRALRAAHDLVVPLIYFHGIEPGRYSPVHPMFVINDDPAQRVVTLQSGLPVADVGDGGLQSGEELRRYATREVRVRLHQHRFRHNVMRAYRGSCAICALGVASLVQAAHIIEDGHPDGAATVVNGIALCAIHHLAYDRNVVGIDPSGVVHIAPDLLDETDGPMLRFGLQEFHSTAIRQPRSKNERPDPERLELRYEQFKAA
ncbi:MAG: HNH endonuclease, partial [Patulibacter sp.]